MALPAIAVKLDDARQSLSDSQARIYVDAAFRLLHTSALTPRSIDEGKGMVSERSINRYAAACDALVKVGLVRVVKPNENRRDQTYRVNQTEIERLRSLAKVTGAMRK